MFVGPEYFHMLYGGFDGNAWRIRHVRTHDFRTFEPKPHNPVFNTSPDPDAWDCDGVLMSHVIKIGNDTYVIDASRKGNERPTGLAVTRAP